MSPNGKGVTIYDKTDDQRISGDLALSGCVTNASKKGIYLLCRIIKIKIEKAKNFVILHKGDGSYEKQPETNEKKHP